MAGHVDGVAHHLGAARSWFAGLGLRAAPERVEKLSAELRSPAGASHTVRSAS